MRQQQKTHRQRVAASAVVIMLVVRLTLAIGVDPHAGACIDWSIGVGQLVVATSPANCAMIAAKVHGSS